MRKLIIFILVVFASLSSKAWNVVQTGLSRNIISLSHPDNGVLFASTTDSLAVSADNGVTWELLPYHDATNSPLALEVRSISFFNAFVGYAVGVYGGGVQDVIFKTIDGGHTWFQHYAGTTGENRALNSIQADGESAVAAGNNGVVLYTIDEGVTWSYQNTQTEENFASVALSPFNLWRAVGKNVISQLIDDDVFTFLTPNGDWRSVCSDNNGYFTLGDYFEISPTTGSLFTNNNVNPSVEANAIVRGGFGSWDRIYFLGKGIYVYNEATVLYPVSNVDTETEWFCGDSFSTNLAVGGENGKVLLEASPHLATRPAISASLIPNSSIFSGVCTGYAQAACYIRNSGTSAITEAKVRCIAGDYTDTLSWTGNLSSNGGQNFFFPEGIPYQPGDSIVFEIVSLNNGIDAFVRDNRSVTTFWELGNGEPIQVSPTADYYTSPYIAINSLYNAATCDTVIIEVADGVYSTSSQVNSANFTGNVILRSASGNPANCILDMSSFGLSFAYLNSLKIEGITLNAGNYFGLKLEWTSNVAIENCIINASTNTSLNMPAIEMTMVDSLIIRNTIVNGGSSGINVASSVYSNNNGYQLIENCTFSNQYSYGLRFPVLENTQIRNNTISLTYSTAATTAIEVSEGFGNLLLENNKISVARGTAVSLAHLIGDENHQTIIRNNEVVCSGTNGIVSTNAIKLDSLRYCSVMFNTIYVRSTSGNSGLECIHYADGAQPHFTFYGNNIHVASTKQAFIQTGPSITGDYFSWLYDGFEYNNFYSLAPQPIRLNGVNMSVASFVSDLAPSSATTQINSGFGSSTAFVANSANWSLFGSVPRLQQVPEDADGTPRNEFTEPGCYEFSLESVNDLGLERPTWSSTACSGNLALAYNLNVIGNTASDLSVTYTINGTPATTNVAGPFEAGIQTLNIANVSLANGMNVINTSISVSSYTEANLLNNSRSDTIWVGGLSGTYIVGSAPSDFATVTAAISALSNGVCGPVEFKLKPGSYTGTYTLSAVKGVSEINTITFSADSEDSTAVTLTATMSSLGTAIFTLSNTDWVRFKGLRFAPLGTSGNGILIKDGSSNLSFENLHMEGNAGVYMINFKPIASEVLNAEVKNCYITNTAIGVVLNSSLPAAANVEIGNCVFTSIIVSAISTFQFSTGDLHIYNNEISTSTTGSTLVAIRSMNYGNTIIENNNIVGSFNTGIELQGSLQNLGFDYRIQNNIVSLYGSTGLGGLSIGGGAIHVLHNTIRVNPTTTASSVAIVRFSEVSGVVVSGNVLMANNGAWLYASFADTDLQNADYNVFQVDAAKYLRNTTFIARSVDWGRMNGMDIHSVQTTFNVADQANLYPLSENTPFAFNQSEYASLVQYDQLGRLRTTPDAGARLVLDNLASNEVIALRLTATSQSCQETSLTATLFNNSSSAVNEMTISWWKDGIAQPDVNWFGVLLPNDTVHVYLGNASVASITYPVFTMRLISVGGVALADAGFRRAEENGVTSPYEGVLTVGTGMTFTTPAAAFNALSTHGICGDVVLSVAPGTYTDQISVSSRIPGTDVHSITFKSMTGNSDVVMRRTTTGGTLSIVGASNLYIQDITFRGDTTTTQFPSNTMFFSGANNLHIDDCRVSGILRVASFSGCYINNVVFRRRTAYFEGSAAATSNNLEITNCTFYYNLSLSTNFVRNLKVSNNLFLEPLLNIGISLNALNSKGNNEVSGNLSSTQSGFSMYYDSGQNNNDHYLNVFNNAFSKRETVIIARNVDFVHNTCSQISFTGKLNRVVNNCFAVGAFEYAYIVNIGLQADQFDYNSYTIPYFMILNQSLPVNNLNLIYQLTGFDEHSVILDPEFDLANQGFIPRNENFFNQGISYPEVSTDVRNILRNAQSPTHGCYETGDDLQLAPDSTRIYLRLLSSSFDSLQVGANNFRLTAIFDSLLAASFGYADYVANIDSIYFSYQLNSGEVVQELWTGSLLVGDTLHYTFQTPCVIPNGRIYNVSFTAEPSSRLEQISPSALLLSDQVYLPMAGNYILGGDTADFVDFVDFNTQYWRCGTQADVYVAVSSGVYSLQNMFRLNGPVALAPHYVHFEPLVHPDSVSIVSLDFYAARRLKFRNFHFTNVDAANTVVASNACSSDLTNDLSFENCTFTTPFNVGSYPGMVMQDYGIHRFEGCSFYTSGAGLSIFDGDFFDSPDSIIVRACQIESATNGISIDNEDFLRSRLVIDGSTISGNYAMRVVTDYPMHSRITNSQFHGVEMGIYCSTTTSFYGWDLQMSNSVVRGNIAMRVFYSNVGTVYFPDRYIKLYHNVFEGLVNLQSVPILDFRNNIVVAREGQVGILGITVNEQEFSEGHFKIDHNIYSIQDPEAIFSGTTLGQNLLTGIEGMEAALGIDLSSEIAFPEFVSETDFHTSSEVVRNKGIGVASVPTDIDGELRDQILPDVGIDEVVGESFSSDLAIALGSTADFYCPNSSIDFTVDVSNSNGADVPYYAVEISRNGEVENLVVYNSLLAANSSVSNTLSVSLAAQVDTISFRVLGPVELEESDLTNNITSEVILNPALQGTYSVGPNEEFASLNEAFDYMNLYGRCGDVVFSLEAGQYPLSTSLNVPAFSEGKISFVGVGNATEVLLTDEAVDLTNSGDIVFNELRLIDSGNLSSLNIAANSIELQRVHLDDIFTSLSAAGNEILMDSVQVNTGSFQIHASSLASAFITNSEFSQVNPLSISQLDSLHFSQNNAALVTNPTATALHISEVGYLEVNRNLFEGDIQQLLEIAQCDEAILATNIFSASADVLLSLNEIGTANLYFNTCVNEREGGVVLQSSISGIVARNNIFQGSSAGVLFESNNNISNDLDYNVWFADLGVFSLNGTPYSFTEWTAALGVEQNGMNVDPVLNGAPAWNFENALLAQSGEIVPTIDTDFLGLPRRTPPSIGAVEGSIASFNGLIYSDVVLNLVDAQTLSSGPNTLAVKIKNKVDEVIANYGIQATTVLDSLILHTSVDGVELTPVVWIGNIAPGDSVEIAWPTSIDIPRGWVYDVRIWAELTSDIIEMQSSSNEDAQEFAVRMEGIYTIGGDFATYEDALLMMEACTFANDVVLQFAGGWLITNDFPQPDGFTNGHHLIIQGEEANPLNVRSSSFVYLEAAYTQFRHCRISDLYFNSAEFLEFHNCVFEADDFASVAFGTVHSLAVDSCVLNNGILIQWLSGNLHVSNSYFPETNAAISFNSTQNETLEVVSVVNCRFENVSQIFDISEYGTIDSVYIAHNVARGYGRVLTFVSSVANWEPTIVVIENNSFLSAASESAFSLVINESPLLLLKAYHNDIMGRMLLDLDQTPELVNNIIYSQSPLYPVLTLTAPRLSGEGSVFSHNLVYSLCQNPDSVDISDTYYGWMSSSYQEAFSDYGFNPGGFFHNPYYGAASDTIANAALIDNMALPLSFITTDVTGAPRSVTPDIGAYEFTSTQTNSGVWPGDTDNNLVVDLFDLLNVGYYYNAQGETRDSISNMWIEHSSWDWFQTDSTGMDLKWVDSDGSGVVNSADTLAIGQNFAQTRSISSQGNKLMLLNSSFAFEPVTPFPWSPGTEVVVDLVYAGADELDMIGLAMDIDVPSELIQNGEVQVLPDAAWAGTVSSLYMNRYLPLSNTLEFAFTKTDGTPRYVSDAEHIAQIRFTLPVDYNGVADLAFTIARHTVMPSSGLVSEIQTHPLDVQIDVEGPSGVGEIKRDINNLVWPNPFNEGVAVRVFLPKSGIWEAEVLDQTGRLVNTLESKSLASGLSYWNFRNGLPQTSGTYFLRFKNEFGESVVMPIVKN